MTQISSVVTWNRLGTLTNTLSSRTKVGKISLLYLLIPMDHTQEKVLIHKRGVTYYPFLRDPTLFFVIERCGDWFCGRSPKKSEVENEAFDIWKSDFRLEFTGVNSIKVFSDEYHIVITEFSLSGPFSYFLYLYSSETSISVKNDKLSM